MSPEKDTEKSNNSLPIYPISGRIEFSNQVAVSRVDNFPIIHTLIIGKAPDEYSYPPRWLVISKSKFGNKGDIVHVKTHVRLRHYDAEVLDQQTGVMNKVRRYVNDVWLAE